MYIVIVQCDIKPEHREAMVEALMENARHSLEHEPGVLRFDLIQDETNPNRVFMLEGYQDLAAYETHRQGPHLLSIRNRIKDWFAVPPAYPGRGFTLFPVVGTSEHV